jgi:hypothetical protein
MNSTARSRQASANEQKQHQQNNQYGFHVLPHLWEEAGVAFVNGRLASSLLNSTEVAKTNV